MSATHTRQTFRRVLPLEGGGRRLPHGTTSLSFVGAFTAGCRVPRVEDACAAVEPRFQGLGCCFSADGRRRSSDRQPVNAREWSLQWPNSH